VSFQWNPQGIELTIMVALILALAGAIVIWHRVRRTGSRTGEAHDDVDRGGQDSGREQV
jgi:hypothetical protein